MAITQTQTNAVDRVKTAHGAYLDDAATPDAMTITVGFYPRYIRVINLTDRIEYEWIKGMAATQTLKTVAAGTRTLDTNSEITIGADGRSFTLLKASTVQNKQYHWIASE